MNRILLSAVLVASLAATSSAIQFHEMKGDHEFSGYLLAKPLDGPSGKGTPSSTRNRALTLMEGHITRRLNQIDVYRLKLPAGMSESQYATQLLASGAFDFVEPDYIVYPNFVPNDALFSTQWQHVNMESALAWDYTFGSTSVISAFTDTGVNLTHPDLAPRLTSGYNAVDRLAQSAGGAVNDIHGHGTFVAGCIGAIGNNTIGVAGVCPTVTLMPIRVSNSSGGGASYSDLSDGAMWAGDHGARVVSASYSGVSGAIIQTTGAYLKSIGVLYCYAAGNDAANLAFDHPDVIVCGATDNNDVAAGFTALGQAIDVMAPGVNVVSTTNSLGYGSSSGTSFSTPITNGLCSLILSLKPTLTPSEVETYLEHGGQDMGQVGNDGTYGWGRLNCKRSLQLVPEGVVRYDATTHHYYERVGSNLNQNYAAEHARWRTYYSLAGGLTSISNSSEQNFLVSNFGASIAGLYIGGFQPAGSAEPGGGWEWIDGPPMTYTNWGAGEPNNSGGTENAIMISDAAGHWNDIAETYTGGTGFLVEYPSSMTNVGLNVDLLDFSADASIPVTVRAFWSGTEYETWNVTGGSSTNATWLRGPLTIKIKASHWLQRNVDFTLTSAGISGIFVGLINGDVDNDNEVGPGDFGALSTSYGAVTGDGNWNVEADLDGDGEVGPSDFGILSSNYGLSGDN